MENKGADVIGFDLPADRSWDLVPFAKCDMVSLDERFKGHIERLKNGWWFAHRLFESKAKVVYGNIYAIPKEIGLVDISTFGAILQHLRDPFYALFNALRLTRQTVIVTELHPEQPPGSLIESVYPSTPESAPIRLINRFFGRETKENTRASRHPGILYFRPNYRANNTDMAVTWWCLPPAVVCEFLGCTGLKKLS